MQSAQRAAVRSSLSTPAGTGGLPYICLGCRIKSRQQRDRTRDQHAFSTSTGNAIQHQEAPLESDELDHPGAGLDFRIRINRGKNIPLKHPAKRRAAGDRSAAADVRKMAGDVTMFEPPSQLRSAAAQSEGGGGVPIRYHSSTPSRTLSQDTESVQVPQVQSYPTLSHLRKQTGSETPDAGETRGLQIQKYSTATRGPEHIERALAENRAYNSALAARRKKLEDGTLTGQDTVPVKKYSTSETALFIRRKARLLEWAGLKQAVQAEGDTLPLRRTPAPVMVRKQWGQGWLEKKAEQAVGPRLAALEEVLGYHVDGALLAGVETNEQQVIGDWVGTPDVEGAARTALDEEDEEAQLHAEVMGLLYEARESSRREQEQPSHRMATQSTLLHARRVQTTPRDAPAYERRAQPQQAQARQYHTTRPTSQLVQQTAEETPLPPPLLDSIPTPAYPPDGIRAQLRQWQLEHGRSADAVLRAADRAAELEASKLSEGINSLTRLPENDPKAFASPNEDEDDARDAMEAFAHSPIDEPGSSALEEPAATFLNPGDLVELQFASSEQESTLAVFVRRATHVAQFYTMQGRWVHLEEKLVQYSIPGWVPASMVEPLLAHMPLIDTVNEAGGLNALKKEAETRDLSVPRNVAGPLVSRMLQFHAESKETYRRHATMLDNAHDILAHDSDLRYGSLVSAAVTLLKTDASKLSLTALYTVRQSLSDAGFGFNIDRRSHRLTGYLQIRSKEQVKTVEQVRTWLREWQDDLALTSTLSAHKKKSHRPSKGASIVYSFLEKARTIVLKSRENRQPTMSGTIGPSKVRFPITPSSDSVKVTTQAQFTESDAELVRFMEAYSLSGMFQGVPRLEALPPLLLQATGLYDDFELRSITGLMFLQELGTIMPYENRVRFDQHLLLPSSQHSRPLQNLMTSLMQMQNHNNFVDSMAELRHDWGDLAVYCIDDAGAHEIDDGLSIEPVKDAPEQWWVHILIANPTAFFSRDHPLAKMARHMGESIYMPERTYMMLPRWATQRHFSLAPGRPCLTISIRVDAEGKALEKKIRAGTVRNVYRLTAEEVGAALGVQSGKEGGSDVVLTVGGAPPPFQADKKREVKVVTAAQVEELRILRRVAGQRAQIRKAAGGLFFDSHKPDIKVWQSWRATGLAWDHPHRIGSRVTEGDPVIQMKTSGMMNWFSPRDDTVHVMVMEMMLLACETAAIWCKERAIPAIFRGSVEKPGTQDSDSFFRDVLAPAAKKSKTGEYPMHLGLQYLQTFGVTQLSTTPFRHKILGMDHYGKVTSPLRRYGDMILHWQIEAALREEARTGQSLVTSAPSSAVDRSFLPFSDAVLSTITVGLRPRENIIMRSKMYADHYWISMLMFRLHHFPSPEHGEVLPFKTIRCWVQGGGSRGGTSGVIVELNISAMILPPASGEELRQGDVWECEIGRVDTYRRTVVAVPLRLEERLEV